MDDNSNRRKTQCMPFGKFRGTPIDELPDDYLEWIRDQEFLRQPLRAAINAEYERRLYSQEQHSLINVELVDELASAGVRTLSKQFHPDVGGSHEAMIALNNCADWLRQQARALA